MIKEERSMLMLTLFWIALVICLVGLVFTLRIAKQPAEEKYDHKTSAKNMSWMYFIFLPIILILLGIFYYFLT